METIYHEAKTTPMVCVSSYYLNGGPSFFINEVHRYNKHYEHAIKDNIYDLRHLKNIFFSNNFMLFKMDYFKDIFYRLFYVFLNYHFKLEKSFYDFKSIISNLQNMAILYNKKNLTYEQVEILNYTFFDYIDYFMGKNILKNIKESAISILEKERAYKTTDAYNLKLINLYNYTLKRHYEETPNHHVFSVEEPIENFIYILEKDD